MARLCMALPGLSHEVILSYNAEIVPSLGDRISVDVEHLSSFYRQLLEETPAFHCFERNEKTECLNMAEYLKKSIIIVSERIWRYENEIACCILGVEVEF